MFRTDEIIKAFYLTDDRQKTTKVYDVFAYATLAHGDKAKAGGKA